MFWRVYRGETPSWLFRNFSTPNSTPAQNKHAKFHAGPNKSTAKIHAKIHTKVHASLRAHRSSHVSRQVGLGPNHPLIHRGREGHVCQKVPMVVANLLWNLQKPALRIFACKALSALGDVPQAMMECAAVARLTGLPKQTVYQTSAKWRRQVGRRKMSEERPAVGN